METNAIAIKFVSHEVPELETLKTSKVYQLREKLNKGEKLSRAEKNWIADAVNRNAFFNRAVPLMGYRFGFDAVRQLAGIQRTLQNEPTEYNLWQD